METQTTRPVLMHGWTLPKGSTVEVHDVPMSANTMRVHRSGEDDYMHVTVVFGPNVGRDLKIPASALPHRIVNGMRDALTALRIRVYEEWGRGSQALQCRRVLGPEVYEQMRELLDN